MRNIIFVFLFAAMTLLGCKDNVTTPPDNARVSLTVRIFSRQIPGALSKTSAATFIDSLKIASARLLVNSIDFEGGDEDSDDDDMEFSAKPMILELSLTDSLQMIMVANVPFGTYDEVEIDIKRLYAMLSPADSIAFADFLAGNGSSVIVEGMTYKNGVATPFVYCAMIRVEQEYELNPPIVVSADNPNANITLAVYMDGWFMWNGLLLDPNDQTNYLPIKWSIENSFDMYDDNDGDGDDDGEDD